MASNGEDKKWDGLSWAGKVQICQQGIADEDSLLHVYVVIFVALEALFFAIIFSVDLWWGLTIVVAVTAIVVVALFTHIFLRRGKAVDRWGEILHKLWEEVGESELAAHYYGSVERMDRYRKCRWRELLLGWGWCGCYSGTAERARGKFGWLYKILKRSGRFGFLNSARWVLITFTPLLLALVWLVIIGVTVAGAFDC